MSTINVNTIRDQGGTGGKVELLASGDVNVNDNKLYVDSSTSKVGINTNTPRSALDITGNAGLIVGVSPVLEKNNTVAGTSNGNTTVNLYNGAVTLYTSANTGNWTPNFTYTDGGSVTTLNAYQAVGETIVCTIISTNGGSTGYINSNIQIDGSGKTVQWSGGTAPTARGGTSGFDVYQFSFFKTGSSAWSVIGSQVYYD